MVASPNRSHLLWPQLMFRRVSYEPSREHLVRYAHLLVNFGLAEGKGIAPGDVVWVNGPEAAKPLFVEVCRAVWRAGGHVLRDYRPSDDDDQKLTRDFYALATDEQLEFFAERFWRGLIDQSDHVLQIRSTADPHALRGIPPERILRHNQSFAPRVKWQQAKEAENRFSFTIGLYGTEAMATEAGLSIDDYWWQIIAACHLDEADPVGRWRGINDQIARQCEFLNSLPIDRLHIEGDDVDLSITLGEKRKWIGGSGRNIPSFEVFTGPDWRGTEGRIRFSEPLYIFGSLIAGIELEFREGRVVSARAHENEELLARMIETAGADRVGEFSLTDARLSPITHFMADTLFDENAGGPFGNTHIALGLGVRNAFDGDQATLTEEQWAELGFNSSTIHADIVSTTDRIVTAALSDGSERVVYASGQFQMN